METQNMTLPIAVNVEPQLQPDEQRYRQYLKQGCEALESAYNWLGEYERATESRDQAQADFDERVKALIANDPETLELERCLHDRNTYCSLAEKELAYAKTKARESFAAAYASKPDEGKRMLDGRISISIRRSEVGHWDPEAAMKEGKALTEAHPLLFNTLFSPIKTGFKKLIGMGIEVSPAACAASVASRSGPQPRGWISISPTRPKLRTMRWRVSSRPTPMRW